MALLRGNGRRLSLIGTGDWNDGFNLVGAQGRGESVWLTWFLSIVLKRFAPICIERGDEKKAQLYTAYAENLLKAGEQAWDGRWYKRAYFDSAPLGAHVSEECRIDSIAQSFAVFAGADRTRCKTALTSAIEHLVDKEARMVRLFTPPFRDSGENPGYIMGYLEGVRENGAQYTHAAIWLAMGCLESGMINEGYEILEMLLPSTHGEPVYRIEPYVLAADVYSNGLHRGRGGWSWYTGSSAWYYRVVIENLLGIRITATGCSVPKIPDHWRGASAIRPLHGSQWNTMSFGRATDYADGEIIPESQSIPRTAKNIRLIIQNSPA